MEPSQEYITLHGQEEKEKPQIMYLHRMTMIRDMNGEYPTCAWE